MFVARDRSERSFSYCLVLQGECLKSLCHVEKEIMSMLFQEKLTNTPPDNATHQHHSTSAYQHISTTNNQQQETNNNHSNKQQHCHQHHNNNHQQPTKNAQSQEQQHYQPPATRNTEDHGDALQAVGFSGAVGAGRGVDALGSHVIEFENSLVAAAEVTCVVPAQTEISDNSSAFHAETVHCWSPCQ